MPPPATEPPPPQADRQQRRAFYYRAAPGAIPPRHALPNALLARGPAARSGRQPREQRHGPVASPPRRIRCRPKAFSQGHRAAHTPQSESRMTASRIITWDLPSLSARCLERTKRSSRQETLCFRGLLRALAKAAWNQPSLPPPIMPWRKWTAARKIGTRPWNILTPRCGWTPRTCEPAT